MERKIFVYHFIIVIGSIGLEKNIYRIYSINSRAYYSKTSEKIRVREFIWMRVLLNGVC